MKHSKDCLEKMAKDKHEEKEEVEMSYPSFKKEHKKLVGTLKKKGHEYQSKALLSMANEQEKEQKEVAKKHK